jgi:hypothetical protein
MKNILSILLILLICASCATPTVINVIGPNDSDLNCKELSSEIAKANQYANDAQEAKKMKTPHNIGAVLLFFPAIGLTMKNVEEATKAANDRALHLNKLKEKKKC